MNCQSIQEKLIDFLYGEEENSSERAFLEAHLSSCSDCSKSYQGYQTVKNLYKNLKDLPAPAHLTEVVFSKIEQEKYPLKGFFQKFSSFILHPAMIALLIFSVTAGVTYFVKGLYPSKPESDLAMKEGRVFRMVDWETHSELSPGLDRPVLKTAELPSLEQASTESVASFKHQRAMHYMVDGDYQKASEVLGALIENDLNYSRWEEAVMQHLELMKKMGRSQEMKKDLARLKEYASANHDLIAHAELVME